MQNLFGEKLRAERKKQSLSAQKLGDICGVSRSYIILIENGKRTPGKKLLPKIAKALNLSTHDVLDWYIETVSVRIKTSLNI